MNALERFLNYVKINTQSDPNSETAPSSMNQFDLANLLVQELKELGVDNVELSKECVVYAWLEANVENYSGKVIAEPAREDIDVPVNETLIVELYSK